VGKFYTPKSRERDGRFLVGVKEYTQYRRDGYLIVKGLLSKEDIAELYQMAEEMRLENTESDKSADPSNPDPLKEEFAKATRNQRRCRKRAAPSACYRCGRGSGWTRCLCAAVHVVS
jgi:phytanoyl-CoA hydroxylase